MAHTVYIGIGSNLGNRLENCERSVRYIAKLPKTRVTAVSRWIINPALGPDKDRHQPDFVNGAVKIETDLKPDDLLAELQDIEATEGRLPNHDKWAARTIDLDILFYDDAVIRTTRLTIPHPEIHRRPFVLKPLCNIEPGFVHPVLKKSVSMLLQSVS